LEGDSYDSSPLDPRLTFETFLIGTPNRLGHAAAQRVASQQPGDPLLYNPLYIHAAVGLGKTHLLQACAQGVKATGRRAIYLTAERFMRGFSKKGEEIFFDIFFRKVLKKP
jgi:chromosomal replication initiator protein